MLSLLCFGSFFSASPATNSLQKVSSRTFLSFAQRRVQFQPVFFYACASTAVVAAPGKDLAAENLSKELRVPLVSKPDANGIFKYFLSFEEQGLSLLMPAVPKLKPIVIDFVSGNADHRRRFGQFEKSPFIRAVGGGKPIRGVTILDATAGFGKDSFVMASLGAHVTMLERNVVLYALLRDALQRASQHPEVGEVVSRMELVHADARQFLRPHLEHPRRPAEVPEVMYMDPMYPSEKHSRSALPKKEIFVAREVVGPDEDWLDLLETGRRCVQHRVVIKRPQWAQKCPAPDRSIDAPNTRFDVYNSTYEDA